MQAVILAGGFGTRLKSANGEAIPKPMAPVGGEPFLSHLLRYLGAQGVREVVLAVHHKREAIMAHFRHRFEHIAIDYVEEETPLGTGGALRRALEKLHAQEPVLSVNGDVFAQLDIPAMSAAHRRAGCAFTLALTHMPDCRRYGQAALDTQGRIASFAYPGRAEPGWVSTGACIVNPDIFAGAALPEAFSFEADFQRPFAPALRPLAYTQCRYFIDIGLPEDYARAQTECARWQAVLEEA